MTETTRAQSTRRSSSPARVIAATAIGNFVEWFDFGIYGFTVIVLADVFFPPEAGASAVLATMAVYGVAFVARPLSAFFFGWVGDRFGRRRALSLSILIMGIATACIGLLPGWAAVGMVAPAMLLLCRLVQGFSAGGEFSGAMTFIIEHAPKHRRGLWMGLVGTSTTIGSMVGPLAVLAAEGISGEAYAEWGWRLPYLAGGVIAIVGLLLRTTVDESPAYTEAKAETPSTQRPLRELFRFYWRGLMVMFVYFGVVGVLAHTFLGYMPTYMTLAGGISTQTALVIMAIVSLLSIGTTTGTGWLVDRYGRRPVFRWGIVGSVVVVFPAYLLIGTGNPIAIGIGLLAFLIPVELLSAGVTIVLEMLPTRVRYSGMALPYNLAYALFAGTAPVVSQGLIDASGSLLAPAYYGTAFGLVALVVLWRAMPESRGTDLKHGVTGHRDRGIAV